jgi:hypothetical protein
MNLQVARKETPLLIDMNVPHQDEKPFWLDLAHKRLDEAVFAAYGWKSDLSDEEVLEKLLALNLERAKG